MEKERRKEMQSMRTTESQELGNTVAQEMEKKRKLAELKKLQAKAKAAQRVSSVSSDESEDDEQAKLKTKAPVSVPGAGGREFPSNSESSPPGACVCVMLAPWCSPRTRARVSHGGFLSRRSSSHSRARPAARRNGTDGRQEECGGRGCGG